MDCSQATAALVDQEIKAILEKTYSEAKQLLTDHRTLLDEIALHLLVKETITGDELMAFVNAENEPVDTGDAPCADDGDFED